MLRMSVNLKWVSLIVLVVQNSFLVCAMRYSKTLPDKYISSTAVVCSEMLKLIISIIVHVYNRVNEIQPPEKYSLKKLFNELFGKNSDWIKITVPAVLYLIQNNLLYFTASKLDAATFQVTYQMKLIITAFFSVLILRRKLFMHQWLSILLLAIGIALVQFPSGDSVAIDSNSAKDRTVGLIGVFCACISSGFAGVYFEKILKNSEVTLWVRNVQLSLFSVIPGFLVGCLLLDGQAIREQGFFGGYSSWTVLTIMCQAIGGIIVAIVVKYADNILKGFANSLSIILSCGISYFIFDFHINLFFNIGCCLVMFSTYLYGKPIKENTEIHYQKVEEIELLENQEEYENSKGEEMCKIEHKQQIQGRLV